MSEIPAASRERDAYAADQVARAQAIASIAHRGQFDKIGVAYIDHPAAVAAAFDPMTEWREHCAGWLHDVVEDTDITADDLRAAGVDAAVVEVVVLLTRLEGVPKEDYYAAIRVHPAAREVKLADIDHNLDPGRTANLEPEKREKLATKYAAARVALAWEESR